MLHCNCIKLSVFSFLFVSCQGQPHHTKDVVPRYLRVTNDTTKEYQKQNVDNSAATNEIFIAFSSALCVIAAALVVATMVYIIKKRRNASENVSIANESKGNVESKYSTAVNVSIASTVKKSNVTRKTNTNSSVTSWFGSNNTASNETICDDSIYTTANMNSLHCSKEEQHTARSKYCKAAISLDSLLAINSDANIEKDRFERNLSVISFLKSADQAYNDLHPNYHRTESLRIDVFSNKNVQQQQEDSKYEDDLSSDWQDDSTFSGSYRTILEEFYSEYDNDKDIVVRIEGHVKSGKNSVQNSVKMFDSLENVASRDDDVRDDIDPIPLDEVSL